MNKYNFENQNSFYMIKGRGNFPLVIDEIEKNFSDDSNIRSVFSRCISNAVVFICGGIRFGSKSMGYYNELLKRLDDIGEKRNSEFIIVRSNGDKPELFDGEKVRTKHVIAVPDYSIVTCKDGSALCVGGSVSLDRSWTKKNIPSQYYSDEAPAPIPEGIEFKDIKYVVSCSFPSFISPTCPITTDWSESDKELENDVIKERNIMDKIYTSLCDGNNHSWYYSKSGNMSVSRYCNIMFFSFKHLSLIKLETDHKTSNKKNGIKLDLNSISTHYEPLRMDRYGVDLIDHGELEAMEPRDEAEAIAPRGIDEAEVHDFVNRLFADR